MNNMILLYRSLSSLSFPFISDLGYAMAIHTSQGMTLKAPQCVWVIDEHLAWDDLIYLAIDCVKYLNHPIQIEDPPLLLLLRLKKNLIMKEKRKLEYENMDPYQWTVD
ncbi:7830_t:CDS:2 [Entrophospora sp. SA101]|nr:7830_t:CDS:2 [Entrophospora sp. SA101]